MNRFMSLEPKEIERLRKNFKPVTDAGKAVRKKLWEAYYWKVYQAEDFEGKSFPMVDMIDIIRCVHEGVCATCGRGVITERSTALWVSGTINEDWTSDETTCIEGHKHTAEPNEIGTDWVGW